MGLFDKMFSGLTKTRKNMVELEELFQDSDNQDVGSEAATHLKSA